jgi:hypothetical protein
MTTVILTGLWCSGKTMAARMIHENGVRMDLDPGGMPDGFEDEAMHYHFTYHPHTLPMDLIRERDAAHPAWGFKHAAAWENLHPQSVASVFREPRVIVMHRDVVNLHVETRMPMKDIAMETVKTLQWAARLECPVLHVSSEMLFRAPQSVGEMIRGFLRLREFSMGTEA